MNSREQKEANKKIIEEFSEMKGNNVCFDCNKSPADWASINNGIFLCIDCSIIHKKFGYNISFIKSATLDNWSGAQINLMKEGGNEKLKQFLISHSIYRKVDSKTLYFSKIMTYYRRKVILLNLFFS